MSHIIVPLDGSELANRALPLAASLAKATGSKLKLLQAAVSPGSLDVAMAVSMILEAAAEDIRQHGDEVKKAYRLEVETRAAVDFPDRLILEEAAASDAIAIVMSTHGRTGLLRLARGSVAESVLRQSPIPVYLVPSAAGVQPEHLTIRRILVPLDGSDLAYTVTAPITRLARQSGAEVTLLRVFDQDKGLSESPAMDLIGHERERLEYAVHEYFSPIKAHMRYSGVMVTAEWEIGTPETIILATADRLGADLIALATHGRSGLARLRHGSVAEAVLRHSTRPVMTFGPEAIRRLAGAVGAGAEAKTRQPALA